MLDSHAAKSVVERLVASWETRDLAALVGCLSDDVGWYDPAMPDPPARGRAAVRTFAEAVIRAFPDFKYEVLPPICLAEDGSRCAVKWPISASHLAPLEPPGYSPTRRRAEFEGVDLLEFEGERVRSILMAFDPLPAAEQLLGMRLRPVQAHGGGSLRCGPSGQRLGWRASADNAAEQQLAVPDSSMERLALADRMAFYKIPGVSIAVIDDNKIDWVKGYGVLKAGSWEPVTPQSIFEAASTSKAVTAAMVLHLVQEGRLNLDEDVNTYLKSWKVPENDMTREKKVTLRLLLSHQSGMPATNSPYDDAIGIPTLVQVLKGESPAQNKPAVVELVPGSQWSYSNLGYVVIQQILKDVRGMPFDRIAREIVFQPLGMTSSTFAYPLKNDLRDREAMPHDEAGSACEPAMRSNGVAQGGLVTTPTDLARFAIELMLAWQGKSDRVLSRETVGLMFSKELDLDPRMFGFPLGEGLGVFLMGKERGLAFSHPGSNWPGMTSWWTGYPELGKGVVIMANGVKGDILSLEILPALASVYGWPVSP